MSSNSRASTTGCLTFSGRRLGGVFTVCFVRPDQRFPGLRREISGKFVEFVRGVDAEQEFMSSASQRSRWPSAEVGVAAETNREESRFPTEGAAWSSARPPLRGWAGCPGG